jgi:hypothetical protein
MGQRRLIGSVVVSLNLHHRHLDESQRSLVAAKMAHLVVGRSENNSANLQNLSQPEAAQLLNVSRSCVVMEGVRRPAIRGDVLGEKL